MEKPAAFYEDMDMESLYKNFKMSDRSIEDRFMV